MFEQGWILCGKIEVENIIICEMWEVFEIFVDEEVVCFIGLFSFFGQLIYDIKCYVWYFIFVFQIEYYLYLIQINFIGFCGDYYIVVIGYLFFGFMSYIGIVMKVGMLGKMVKLLLLYDEVLQVVEKYGKIFVQVFL